MKDRKEMAEMAEMHKAFDDFDKACAKVIGACQDFIDMDIKTTKPTLEERASSPADDARKNPTQRDEVATITPYERKRLEPLPGSSKLGCPRSP